MKKQTLILAIILSTIFSLPKGTDWGGATINAQQDIPFPTDSAQWSVRHTINSPFSQNTFQYKMKGDTLLNGITYHKIYYSLDLNYSSPNNTLHCFVREDTTKKVFVKYPPGMGVDTSEFMLYNFNIAVGDSVNIKLLYFNTDSIYKLRVTNINSFQTNVDSRNYYQLYHTGLLYWHCTEFTNFGWIEGIGSTLGPFYNEVPQGGCDNGGYEVSCYWYKGIYIGGGNSCDYSTGIGDAKNNYYNTKVFPNPLNDISFIEFADKQFIVMEIYNTIGEKVKDINIKDKEKVSLNKTDYSTGLFIYRLISQNGYYQTGNFIVQ